MLRAAQQTGQSMKAAAASLHKDVQARLLLAELATWLQQYPCRELYCLPDDGASSDSLQGLGYMSVLLLAETSCLTRDEASVLQQQYVIRKTGKALVMCKWIKGHAML